MKTRYVVRSDGGGGGDALSGVRHIIGMREFVERLRADQQSNSGAKNK